MVLALSSCSSKVPVEFLNRTSATLSNVSLNGVQVIGELGPSQSVVIKIERVGTNLPFTFEVFGELIEKRLDLVKKPEIDMKPKVITIAPGFNIDVQLAGV